MKTYPTHPCTVCGILTANRLACSRRCGSQFSVNARKGKPLSAEHRERLGATHRGKPAPASRATALHNLEKIRQGHPPRRTIQCQFCKKELEIANRSTRKFCSVACSHANSRGVPSTRERNSFEIGSGIAGYRDDLSAFYRSRWEANFARALKAHGTPFLYEPERFTITLPDHSTTTYCPDFLVDGEFIEIKGFWRGNARAKVHAFQAQYPDHRLRIIEKAEYWRLEREVGPTIEHWEWADDTRRGIGRIMFCQGCGTRTIGMSKTARYCTYACWVKHVGARRPRESRKCVKCGAPFQIVAETKNLRQQARRHCSHRCAVQDNIRIALGARWDNAGSSPPNRPASAEA